MRNLAAVLSFGCLSWITLSCTTKDPIQRLRDFEYPEDSLKLGQIFIYQDKSNPTADCVFITQLIVKQENVKYLIQQIREGVWKRSYERFLLEKESILLDLSYNFTYPDSAADPDHFAVSELILRESKNITDKPFRGVNRAMTIEGFIDGSLQINEQFNRRDTLKVMDEFTEVLVFDDEITARAEVYWLPFLSSRSVYREEVFLGRSRGLVRYSTSYSGNKIWWELIAVKRLPKSSWPLNVTEITGID